MLRLRRWMAVVLTVCIFINIMPLYVIAGEFSDEPQTDSEILAEVQENNADVQSGESQPTKSEAEPSPTQAEQGETMPAEETQVTENEPEQPPETAEPEIIEEFNASNAPSLAAIPQIGDTFADSFIAVLNEKGISATINKDENDVITLTINDGQGEILELLSQQTQSVGSNYQNWNIRFTFTGSLTLSDSYMGLGDDDFPFIGKFTDQSITIKSSKTIFKALGAQAELNGVKIEWTGAPGTPILAKTLVADDAPRTVAMSLAKSGSFSPYIGKLTGESGLVTLPTLDYSEAYENTSVIYNGDAGLVCGSMTHHTKLQIDTLTLPNGRSVYLHGNGDVGGLVGSMGESAELTVSKNLTLNAALQGNNAGGLAGSIDNKAVISFAEGAIVSVDAVLTATKAAGGIAGVVVTETGPLRTNANNVVLTSVNAKGTENSGVFYGTCTVTGEFNPMTGVSFGGTSVMAVSGSGSCGGVFGTLTLEGNGKCSLNTAEINTSLTTATKTTAYGGVAGTLEGKGEGRKNALVVNECNVTTNIEVGNNTDNYPKYIGGIVAMQQIATVDAKNSTITVNDPKTKKAEDRGFGGVSAYLDDGALLIADTMTVKTNAFIGNDGGGGVVGSAHKGSIVYLKNSLDLSNCLLTTNATSGQIVGSQDCSLVYAPNVEITRLLCTTNGTSYDGVELDDIGNYGELYRLADFLNVNETTYETSFLHTLSKTGEEYVLSSPFDYACLALAWQSRGYFPTVEGITDSNWATLKSCTIKLGDNLTLTGCGIGGLTRDVYSTDVTDDTFSGTFDGNGKKITLAIGEKNTKNNVSKGDGRIYWHNATGLFAVLSSGATVHNLTLYGSIRVSNNKFVVSGNTIDRSDRKNYMKSGGLAALLSGTDSTGTIKNVSTEISFDAVSNGGNRLYVGGLVGLISDTGTTAPKLELTSGTKLAATFKVTHSGKGDSNHFGGAIGAVNTSANVNIVCDGATLGGSIVYNNPSNNTSNIYAGGLVGTIFPNGSGVRTINLTSLTVNDFALTGRASVLMGGILGGIWADTDVTVDGLTVSSTTLTANGNAALGGLVYRASGKWTVSSADLSGLSITAPKANALGLLICQGGPYKDMMDGSYVNIDGLYLEMTEHWNWIDATKKGYKVPSSITFGSGVFDEFVAYTAYADRSSDTPNYDITHNESGIISLKTDNGTVNMTSGERNTYENRTTVGESKQTNLYSRYYYNLPEVMKACDGGDINTAEELLIWSVYKYAASNLHEHFNKKVAVRKTIIGGTSVNHASFDMDGLSYYPINITNSNVTVQYADVKFYNDKIEEKEAGNKLTRGTDDAHSQHYTMHCALFLDFTADLKNITKYEDRTMTVNGVSFAGTVGVVNGGSGALICGTVKGDTKEGNTSTCNVILAEKDIAANAVSLNGLSVVPAGDYTPALINKVGSYTGLKANYVTANQAIRAGSSLIGDVGGQGATGVSVEFAGTIKLPENGVFTEAILLNSLRYENGSATYRFYKSKDYDENTYVHNATHGRELSTTVEYAGKQGCYYDGYGTGHFVSNNKNFDSQNDFTSYRPYVAFSPATQGSTHPLSAGWHELAVNVLSSDLTDGCGTYGHPYQVDANLLKEAANYINTGVASNGWQVRVPKPDDTEYHTDENNHDVLLTYTEKGWKNGETPYTGDVRKHLQSAYYQIKEDIELSNFNGIGTDKYAFTGVIKGKDANITVTLSEASTAFIKYSYGSVVRDLKVVLNQTPTLNRTKPSRPNGLTEPKTAPDTFFGGVIGCVLGGDNIIENVTIQNGENFNISPTGENTHLVPVGGYVGVIAGGGVIFRGSYSNSTGVTGTGTQLYRNPIIGRVLGGYAFYEGTGTAPDNGNKDYKINKITFDTPDLSWNGSTLKVNNAQGLLILSAIVSSGAGSKSSNAYAMGKARNAAYDKIGADTKPNDYDIAKKDDGAVWSNAQVPYLLSKYADYTGNASICTGTDNGIDIEFTNATFDMETYGNGYRGLSARYVSNSAFKTSGATVSFDASTVVMRVKTFYGKNADVQNINMDVKEYEDDDFHMASMGGIFNIVWTQKQSGGGGVGSNFAQNLTLTNCNVSLKYVDSSGDVKSAATDDTFARKDGMRAVSVGGFIGMANDIEAIQGSINHNYLFTNIHIKGTDSANKCQIYGPNSAGGLIGTTAMASEAVSGYPGKLLANGKWALFGPSFLNCSYSNVEVSGGLAAGGLVGDAYANSNSTIPNFNGLGLPYSNGSFKCYTSCTVTKADLIVGQNSTITARAKGSIAGGLFGGAGMRIGINDPEANTKSGITIANAIEICKLQILNVDINVSKTDYDPGNVDYPDSSINNAYAAGIIGRIGNVNPSCFYDITISGGGVTSTLATSSYVGGLQGSGYTNSEITVQRCQISSFNISGSNAGGLLGSGKNATGFKLNALDCKLEDCTIKGTKYTGGLVGEAASTYNLFNILMKNTSITGGKAGRLFGYMIFNEAGSDFKVNAAGISVYVDKSTVKVPEAIYGTRNREFDYIGYIAYADYAGTETTVLNQQAPYVTANPNFTLTADKTLYGDAVGKITDDTYGSVAARIWADNKIGATGKKNLASYPRAAAIVNTAGKADPVVSTFKDIQGCGPDNLPVLVLKGADAGVIEDYLNVITNGGYSEATVTPTVSVYYYDKDNDTFELDAAKLNNEPASIYYRSSDNKLCVRNSSFDNTRNRFSLVEASFEVKVNDVKHTYTVSVPVVVIRELQYNFIATFSYGAEFEAEVYDQLKTHVLESTGNPFTAYLTYQYNREKANYVEYDWQSYMDDGGNMLNVDKILSFSSGLPSGTQMILVDCQNGNRAYQYTTMGTNTNAKTDVRLSDFTSVCDGAQFQSSMAEILGVTSSESESGKYVVETNPSKATVRLKNATGGYTYYRPLGSGETTGSKRYDLTVPNLKVKAPEENYYLVITVPEQSDNPDFYINGKLESSLNWQMPSKGTQIHRYNKSTDGVGNNDESTYQISTGYHQTLVSTAVGGEPINLGSADQKMQVMVKDTITFSNQQAYGESDKLYLQLSANLQEFTADPAGVTENQFPAGTTGTVHFYIQDGAGKYFTLNDGTWTRQDEKNEAASYQWASRGDNIELLLSKDGTTALDLSGVRQLIKGTLDTGSSEIIVTAEMDIEFSGQEVLNATVPASDKNGADKWAQLHYVGRISTQEFSLEYSSARATTNDNAKYYRAVAYQAILSMDAASINQLGINPLELVPNYMTTVDGKKASCIDLTAALNLANLQDIENVLKNTEKITFKLSLQRRQGDTYVDVDDASQYIAFDLSAYQLDGWSWTIPKDQYYKDGAIFTTDIFDGVQFTMPIPAYVFTDQKNYANYKIKLTVSFVNNTGVAVNDSDAYVVYTFACIKPAFYDPSGG